MAPKIRPFESSDYAAYRSIHDEIYPMHPLNLEASKHEDWWFGRTRFKLRRYVAEVGGNVVAVGSFFHEVFSYNPGVFCIRVEVHPRSQRQGIGRQLCEELLSELGEMGAERVWSPAILPHSPSSRFAENRGFVHSRFDLESVLDLRRLDPAQVDSAMARIREDGIEVRNLAGELASDPEAGRKLYELEMRAGDDVPRIVKSEDITFDEYSMVILENPTYLLEGSFMAKLDGKYVGSSNLWKAGPVGFLTQGFTAVRKEYRRRGIATALKLMVAKAASSTGAKYLRTSNDSANKLILELNTSLGFKRTQTWAIYQKQLR